MSKPSRFITAICKNSGGRNDSRTPGEKSACLPERVDSHGSGVSAPLRSVLSVCHWHTAPPSPHLSPLILPRLTEKKKCKNLYGSGNSYLCRDGRVFV